MNEAVSVDPQQEQRPARRVLVPVTRSLDREHAIELSLELPGVPREDIELTLEGRRLSVRARAAEQAAPEGMRSLHVEIEEADFEARFQLPRGIATEQVEARHQDGVLTLSFPKAGAERQTIPVRGA